MDSIALTKGKRGAISEMVVASDLLNKGYEVFRSVSQDCSCDLLALKDGSMLRIEVRTGQRNQNGTLGCSVSEKDLARFDVLAIVIGGEIVYQTTDEARDEWSNKKRRNGNRFQRPYN